MLYRDTSEAIDWIITTLLIILLTIELPCTNNGTNVTYLMKE